MYCPVIGDVTEIKFISPNHFVCSSSAGNVKVFKLQDEPFPEIKEENAWDKIHRFRYYILCNYEFIDLINYLN